MERTPKLRIEMFGGFRCSIDGESPIGVPPGYITRLLLYLAAHPNQEIARETLCDLFWEGVDPASEAIFRTRGLTLFQRSAGVNVAPDSIRVMRSWLTEASKRADSPVAVV